MRNVYTSWTFFVALVSHLLLVGAIAHAQTPGKATVFLSPARQSVIEGTNFEVGVYINTQGKSVNTVELHLKFPADKLSIIQPSGGKSLVGIWIEPPSYSNTEGTAGFAGMIPNGITTQSGLITSITFKAKTTGDAVISILPETRVLANDGLGTDLRVDFGRATITVTPKPPEGAKVFSETHQFTDQWYNNKNPVITWEKEQDVTDFSYEIDNKPLTIPDNLPETQDTLIGYEGLSDGVWFFHIKARKKDVWGATSQFPIHIDTAAPAEFSPRVEIFAGTNGTRRALVTFRTTDALSGLRNYEVGVLDKKKLNESPLFVEASSPHQLPDLESRNLRVIVRAIDNAGNVRDASVDASMPFPLLFLIREHSLKIVIGVLVIILILLIIHYLYGHHIIRHIREAYRLARNLDGKGGER